MAACSRTNYHEKIISNGTLLVFCFDFVLFCLVVCRSSANSVCFLFGNLQKEDPLKRIQAEINEVEQRERELREKKMMLTSLNGGFVAGGAINQSNGVSPSHSTSAGSDGHSSISSTPDKEPNIDSVSAFSDDSGISSSSSPVNGQSTNGLASTTHSTNQRYVRSSTMANAITPSPSMTSLNRTQTFATNPRFQMNPARKGIMQRFIATRGKIAAANAAAAAANNNNENEMQRKSSRGESEILVSKFFVVDFW